MLTHVSIITDEACRRRARRGVRAHTRLVPLPMLRPTRRTAHLTEPLVLLHCPLRHLQRAHGGKNGGRERLHGCSL